MTDDVVDKYDARRKKELEDKAKEIEYNKEFRIAYDSKFRPSMQAGTESMLLMELSDLVSADLKGISVASTNLNKSIRDFYGNLLEERIFHYIQFRSAELEKDRAFKAAMEPIFDLMSALNEKKHKDAEVYKKLIEYLTPRPRGF